VFFFWRFHGYLVFAGFILSLKSDEWLNKLEQNKLSRAVAVVADCLGPTLLKSVALSTRPDLIRKDFFLDELVKLQDQLPAF